jgi:hypothetical protein
LHVCALNTSRLTQKYQASPTNLFQGQDIQLDEVEYVKSKNPYEPLHLMEVTITSINEPTIYDKNVRIKSVGFFGDRDRKTKYGQKPIERKIPDVGPAF